MEESFLYALAFFITKVIFKQLAIFVCYNEFIIYYFYLIFF